MATAKSNVNVKIDSWVKERATELLNRMGIDQTTAIDMFYRQIIAERKLPFQPCVEDADGEMLMNAIKRKGTTVIDLDVNEKGHVVIDKHLHPDLYNWAVNG